MGFLKNLADREIDIAAQPVWRAFLEMVWFPLRALMRYRNI